MKASIEWRHKTISNIRNLFPGYFALVMATGIIGTGMQAAGIIWLSEILFYLNIAFFLVLVIQFLLRIAFFFPNIKADIMSHEKGPGFFSLVAGSCVLGIQFVLLKQAFIPGLALWSFALVVWFLLMLLFSFQCL